MVNTTLPRPGKTVSEKIRGKMLQRNMEPVILHCNKIPNLPSSKEITMVVDLFNKALETPKTLPQPLVKANKLFVENMEKLLVLQMNSLKSYLDIGLNQMRAAAEITDLQSLQDFYKRQAEIAQTVQTKLLNDARVMANMAARFKNEMDHLTQATLEETLPKAA